MGAEREFRCREAVRLLLLAFERALTDDEERDLKGHLAACGHCDNYDRQLRFLSAAASRFAR
ncbi:MAG: zf-HC2 domain-containing protein [Betaproteobacteria bacterium]|nr:zf-HC2 domain-containing protein [Betaproteobacteria bacterium]